MKSRINYYLKKNTGAGADTALVLMRVSNPNFEKKFMFSTGHTVRIAEWDSKNHRCLEKRSMTRENKNINESLDLFVSWVSDFERKLEIEGTKMSYDLLRGYLEKKTNREKKVEVVDIPSPMAFITQYIEQKKLDPKTSDETTRQYRIAFEKFEKYINKKGDDWAVLEKPSFVREFHAFLYSEFKMSTNTAAKTTKHLNTFLLEAKKFNYLSEKAIPKFRVKDESSDAVYLNESELKTLIDCDLGDNFRLERIRDLFIFACFTGLRFEDWTKIKREHIIKIDDKVEIIKFMTSKTKEVVFIPLLKESKRILEKYDYELPTSKKGKPVSNQKTNVYLKELSKIAGFTEVIPITKNVAGHRKEFLIEKCELISSHTARRSFITNMIARGLNYETISKATGHRDFDSFKKYNKLDGERAAAQMFRLIEGL